jgi:hypothetical protein
MKPLLFLFFTDHMAIIPEHAANGSGSDAWLTLPSSPNPLTSHRGCMNGGRSLPDRIICGYVLSVHTTYFLFSANCRHCTFLGRNDLGARRNSSPPKGFKASMIGKSLECVWFNTVSRWGFLWRTGPKESCSLSGTFRGVTTSEGKSPNTAEVSKRWSSTERRFSGNAERNPCEMSALLKSALVHCSKEELENGSNGKRSGGDTTACV